MLIKLKSYLANDHLFYGLVTLLVAGVSFGMGRISAPDKLVEKSQNQTNYQFVSGVESEKSAEPTKIVAKPTKQPLEVGSVVASKTGTRYHAPSCPGAKQIKPENLIQFSSPATAAAAGYKPAANCPEVQ